MSRLAFELALKNRGEPDPYRYAPETFAREISAMVHTLRPGEAIVAHCFSRAEAEAVQALLTPEELAQVAQWTWICPPRSPTPGPAADKESGNGHRR